MPTSMMKMFDNSIENSGFSSTYDAPNVTVSRRKALMFADSGKVDHAGTQSLFGQIMSEIHEDDSSESMAAFQKTDVEVKCFECKFLGEGGIDAGGLFRDALVDISKELQSDVLPLLTKTPNNKNDSGNFRECFILNPHARSPTHL